MTCSSPLQASSADDATGVREGLRASMPSRPSARSRPKDPVSSSDGCAHTLTPPAHRGNGYARHHMVGVELISTSEYRTLLSIYNPRALTISRSSTERPRPRASWA